MGGKADWPLPVLARRGVPPAGALALTSDREHSNTSLHFAVSRDKEVYVIIDSQKLIFIKTAAQINRELPKS